MRETDILFQIGRYWVSAARFRKSEGFAVWRIDGTHSVRVASIGFPAPYGLSRARAEAAKRAGQETLAY